MAPGRTSIALVLGVAIPPLLTLGLACDGDSTASGAACPHDLPASCPSDVPSYQTDIAPIIERRCFPCHDTGGIEAPTHDFSTYDVLYAQRTTILSQIYDCRMPPPDAGQPTADERRELLTWFVCHAPNN